MTTDQEIAMILAMAIKPMQRLSIYRTKVGTYTITKMTSTNPRKRGEAISVKCNLNYPAAALRELTWKA